MSYHTTSGTNWDEKWHDVKIVRRVADGTIEVYFDDIHDRSDVFKLLVGRFPS